jgi:recombination protein RecA
MSSKDLDKKIRELSEMCTTSAETVISRKRTILSVSPTIDNLTGGGITTGSLAIFRGPPKVGKTTTILHFASKAQKYGFSVCYLNIEGRLSERDLQVKGLDMSPEKFEVVESPEVGNILSGEDFLAIAEYKLKTRSKLIVIFDSFSQLISQDAKESDLRERVRDPIHITISRFCKRVLPILSITDNICVGVTHDVANQGYGHSTKSETSGTKIQYANNFKLYAKFSRKWEEGKRIVGQDIDWFCENTSLGIPQKLGVGKLRYGEGIDEVAEILPLANDTGVISAGHGGNYKYDGKNIKGAGNFVDYLKENPEVFAEIYKEVRLRLESHGLDGKYLDPEVEDSVVDAEE